MRALLLSVLAPALTTLAGCPPPQQGGATEPGGGGGGRAQASGAIQPDSCGRLDTSAAGRKAYAFLQASAELDRASLELETTIGTACRRMASELGVATDGDTRTVCHRAAKELEANLQISVTSESRLVTRTEPAVCTTDLSLTAGFVAECEGGAAATGNVRCQGSTDREGRCVGYAEVDASVECKASAEVRAGIRTTCTEPKVVMVREDVTVIDDTKFQAAMRAIDAGLPPILSATAKLELAGKAVANWVGTGAELVQASGELLADLGAQALCVGAQFAAIAAASSQIQARFTVSIEVSAQVTASAGGSAGASAGPR